MEASEFFEKIADYFWRIIKSFNKTEFPEETLNLVNGICDFIEKEKNV